MAHDADRHPADWEEQRERLSAYLDGELSADERAALERHLPGCAHCQSELAQLRQVRALLGALPSPALPRSFLLPEDGAVPEPIAARRRSGARLPASAGRALQWVGSAVAAAGVVLLLGSALAGTHGLSSTSSSGAANSQLPPSASQEQTRTANGGTSDKNFGSATPATGPSATPQGTPGRLPDTTTTETPGAAGHPSPTPSSTVPTPTPTSAPAPVVQPGTHRANSYASDHGAGGPLPEPLTGVGLMLGGVVVVVAGSAVRRRAGSA